MAPRDVKLVAILRRDSGFKVQIGQYRCVVLLELAYDLADALAYIDQ
jgi:hypothetical protein